MKGEGEAVMRSFNWDVIKQVRCRQETKLMEDDLVVVGEIGPESCRG